MTAEEPEVVRPMAVTIYGRTYQLRGNEDEQYLARLATLVDHKMREVAQVTGTADTLKVAILAALNIADDALQIGEGADPRSVQARTEERVARMVGLLDEALAG